VVRESRVRAILLAGFVAGVLDISDAFVVSLLRGSSPGRVLQYIASGALGQPAFDGGGWTMALGLLFHFCIATSAAAVFVTASIWLPVLLRQPVICGIAFGIGWHYFMTKVVLPLSHVRMATVPPSWPIRINGIAAIGLLVGLPIALIAARMLRRR